MWYPHIKPFFAFFGQFSVVCDMAYGECYYRKRHEFRVVRLLWYLLSETPLLCFCNALVSVIIPERPEEETSFIRRYFLHLCNFLFPFLNIRKVTVFPTMQIDFIVSFVWSWPELENFANSLSCRIVWKAIAIPWVQNEILLIRCRQNIMRAAAKKLQIRDSFV